MKISITGTRTGPDFADTVSFPIKCPKCGHESKRRLADMEGDPLIVCTSCGQKIQLESNGSAKEAMDSIRDLDRTLNDLFKKR